MVLIGSESSTTVVCVLVLFHPEMEVLGTIQRLSLHYPIVLVVNAASTEFLARLQGSAQIHLLRNERNIGLASALNCGAEYAFENWGHPSLPYSIRTVSPRKRCLVLWRRS